MSTEFINDQWRLPNAWNGSESNVNKQSNYSMNFSSQYIDVSDKFNFIHNTKTFSISVWLKMDSYNTNTSSVILGNNYTSSQIGFQFWIDNRQDGNPNRTETLKFNLWDGTNSSALLEDNVVSDNNWHNYVVVGDGTTLKYYKDGTQLTDTDSLPVSTSSTAFTNLRLGANTISTPSAYLNGKIDGVSIFNYALSSSQVTTLYGSSSTGIGNPMTLNPVAYYPLGDQDSFNGSNYLVPNSSLKDYVFDFIDGNNTFINCGANENILDFSGNNYTVSAWVNWDGIGDANQMIASVKSSGSHVDFALTIEKNDGKISYWNGSSYRQSNSAIPTGVWCMVTIIVKATQKDFFINGVADGTPSQTRVASAASGTNFLIGKSNFGNEYFNGKISNVQIFNTELPATGSNSIETLYNNGSPLTSMSGFTSLVSWWKLDASDTYDGTNWTIEDHAGSNDGTSSGMTQANLVQSDLSFKNSYSPFALNFDGADDAINISNNSVFNLGTSFTISGWFNFASVGYYGLISFDSSSTRAWFLYQHVSLGIKLFDGVNAYTLSSYTTTGKWDNFIVTYDGTNLVFYINGVQESTQAISINLQTNGNDGQIGNNQAGSGRYYNGSISNLSIWNAALTSSQVKEIYSEGIPQNLNNHSAYSNLISWWQLGSNSSFNTNWTVLDEKGSNNGVSSNMTEVDIVDGVGSYANGVSSGMSDNIVGDAFGSSANSLSYNMDVLDRSTDVPN